MSIHNEISHEVQSIAPWVESLIGTWGYSQSEARWFCERLAEVPVSATCAGAFVANAADLLPMNERAVALAELHFQDMPNRFRSAPLNHFLVTLAHVGAKLGRSGDLATDLATVQAAISRGFGAALIRATLPGFEGMQRIGEILRLTARALSGTMFSDVSVSVERTTSRFLVKHVQEHNFLAHFHYGTAYYQICGAEYGPAERTDFKWTGVNEATVTIYPR